MNRRICTGILCLIVLFLVVPDIHASPSTEIRRPLNSHQGFAIIEDGKKIFFATRNTPDASQFCVVGDLRRYQTGSHGEYRLPFETLCPSLQLDILRVLFPDDMIDSDNWHHRVTYHGVNNGGENLFRIAQWFTGTGSKHRDLEGLNSQARQAVKLGMTITIPRTMLSEALREALKAEESTVEDTLVQDELTYETDQHGRVAVYHLKKGEALYSAVVMRFTGRMLATEVNELAMIIAERSGIVDVTNIPVDYAIKVPLEYLTPEYLPADDPLYIEYARNREESERYARNISARDLDHVMVVIDSGHGGRDPGALGYFGVVEAELVYDIACRIRRLLLTKTRCQVQFTNYDPIQKYTPRDLQTLAQDDHEYLLTSPPYRTGESAISANLRWYLANSLHRKWIKTGSKSDDTIVFLSLHADALHPSACGTMIYFCAADMHDESYGKSGAPYKSFKEFLEQPTVRFSAAQRYQSEAYSRKLAKSILRQVEARNISIHPRKPIREFIVRKNRIWVPAILKYNTIPAKILIEVGNLKNENDCKKFLSPDFREQFAQAVVMGIVDYFK